MHQAPTQGPAERVPNLTKPGGMLGMLNKACSSYNLGKSGDKKDQDLAQDFAVKLWGMRRSLSAQTTAQGAACTTHPSSYRRIRLY